MKRPTKSADCRPPGPPRAQPDWAYFLDVDGTLIDIARTPDAAHIDEDLRGLVARIHVASGGAVALISGRAISDLETRLAGLRVPFAGQHGLERRDAAGRLWIHPTDPQAKIQVKESLQPFLARHSGLLLEDKGLTLALHYRLAPHLAGHSRRIMLNVLSTLGAGFELQFGKCVVELKPAGVDKGTAVAEYLREPPFRDRRPVFIGDDLNDEHGFALVNGLDGISIKVGLGRTCARYRLRNVATVRKWLNCVLETPHERP
ncbi:MAG: trehalose-phosphatase [Thermomicrobiales bacterium]|jgi:trehalose 6-phosphate phosphatase|nr:MAG: trehalose-phosphatase [Thermomicrobiales bacterium]